MTIDKISIDSFGKLSNLEIVPEPGLNIIYAPNESGKTTLLSFIKFVFYGTRQKKLKGDMTFKEKYMPWSGMPMSGSIEFTHNGKKYIIYRNEGAKNGSRKLEIKELSTGMQCNIAEPGRHFFSVGEKAFSDSCFVTDIASITDSDDDIISLLSKSNVDTLSYGRVKGVLEEKILSLSSPKRSSSALSLLSKQLGSENSELISTSKELSHVADVLSSFQSKQAALRSELGELDELLAHEAQAGRSFQYYELLSDLERECENHEVLSSQLASVDIRLSQTDEKSLLGKFGFLMRWISASMTIVLATFAFFAKNTFVTAAAVLGAVVCFLTLLFQRKNRPQTKDDGAQLSAVCSALQRQIELSQRRIDDIKASVLRFETSNPDIVRHKNQNEAQRNSFTKEELNGIIDRKERCTHELKALESRCASLSERHAELSLKADALRFSIDNLDQKICAVNSKLEVYRTALSILESAFCSMRDEFAPRLCADAFEMLSAISEGEFDALVANESFEASVKINSDYKDVKSLSGGTRSLVYLALRMAVCDYMSPGESVPVFLDDVLSAFDDDRCARMMHALGAMSRSRQIFLCTCRSREAFVPDGCGSASIFSIGRKDDNNG